MVLDFLLLPSFVDLVIDLTKILVALGEAMAANRETCMIFRLCTAAKHNENLIIVEFLFWLVAASDKKLLYEVQGFYWFFFFFRQSYYRKESYIYYFLFKTCFLKFWFPEVALNHNKDRNFISFLTGFCKDKGPIYIYIYIIWGSSCSAQKWIVSIIGYSLPFLWHVLNLSTNTFDSLT